MNSDFMQQHTERLAEQVADEPDDAARIAKVYRRLFGRAPTADETRAGRDFLQAEALKQYEERRAKAKMPPDKNAAAEEAADKDAADADAMGVDLSSAARRSWKSAAWPARRAAATSG